MVLYLKKLFIIFLVRRLCSGQSTSGDYCSTCSAAPTCTGYNVNADVVTSRGTSWTYFNPYEPGVATSFTDYNPAYAQAFLQASLIFTAYSVTSTSSVTGNCLTYTSSPVPLVDAQIFPVPLTVETENYSSFVNDAYSSFYATLGYKGCIAALTPGQSLPTYQGMFIASTSATTLISATAAETSATTLPSVTSAKTAVLSQHVHSTQIIILSIVVPSAGLIILLLYFIFIRRYRKKRSLAASTNHPAMTSNVQLYLDQKAELEDEERRKHELDAGGNTYEMEGKDCIFEMPGAGNTETRSASCDKVHELRGAEHSRELEVLGKVEAASGSPR